MTTPTPSPWSIEYGENEDNQIDTVYGIDGANGKRVVVTDCGYYPPKIVDAKHIVHCVNTHDALVMALQELVDELDLLKKSGTLNDEYVIMDYPYRKAKEVLKNAKGAL